MADYRDSSGVAAHLRDELVYVRSGTGLQDTEGDPKTEVSESHIMRPRSERRRRSDYDRTKVC